MNKYQNTIGCKTKADPLTELCELFYKYGSDKIPQINHSYSPEYFNLLNPYRYSIKTVLEIGIGNASEMQQFLDNSDTIYQPGASLKAWRDFFPYAQVFGLDIVESILFEEDRIKCFLANQTDSISVDKAIKQTSFNKFDLIIDDGIHSIDSQLFCINMFCHNYVSDTGIYIVEDVQYANIPRFPREINGFKIIKEHTGLKTCDSFLAYKK